MRHLQRLVAQSSLYKKGLATPTMTMYQGQGVSFEQALEAPQRTQKELNDAIATAAAVLVRYAQQVRPNIQTPPEVLLAANATLQSCAMSVIERIDQSGKLRAHTPQQQQQFQQAQSEQQTQVAIWRSLAGVQGQGSRRNRSGRRGSPSPVAAFQG